METLFRELRYGFRALAKSPGFSAIAVLTLALGIGASTAIFSVVDAVLLRALPYPEPEKIVRIWEQASNGHRMNVADPNLNDFRAQNNTLAGLSEYAELETTVAGGSEPVRAPIAEVANGFFQVLGVAPFLGRGFVPDEDRLHGTPAAIVSYGFWQRYLGGAADLSQFHLRMVGGVYPVIGVMPPGFDYPAGFAAWVPREFNPDVSRTAHNWRLIGRLRDGVTVAQARANLSTIARRIKEQYGPKVTLVDAAVVPLADALVGNVRTALLTLLVAVGLLLLVACANVAGLLVARTSARRKELAVRMALGAGRGRLMQQFLAESFLLSIGGGLLGMLIASWAVRVLPAILPANLPRQQGIAINPSVLLFGFAAVLAVAVSLGLFAAWRAASGGLQEALSAGSRGNSGAGLNQRLRGLVVTGEIAATLMILTGAGLLGRSFLRLISTNPGFSPQNLITIQFPLPIPQGQLFKMDAATIARQVHLADAILTRIRAIPGAGTVGFGGAMPVAEGDNLVDATFVVLNGQKPLSDIKEFEQMAADRTRTGGASYCIAGEAYFRALGIPLIRGRMFGEQDDSNSPTVALISQTLARQRWPDQDPTGQVIEFGNLQPLTIVGVVGDVRALGLDRPASPLVYVDYRQHAMDANSTPTILMRTGAPTRQMVSAARDILRDLAPDAPLKFATFEDAMGGWLADRRFLLLLVGLFAASALVLAAVGIYGLVAFAVTRRTQEIGVRVALGAQRSDVLRLVVGESARLAVLGVAIGMGLSFLVTRLLASLLFGISATDPITFAGVALLLSFVALLASYIPARRAMRLDPNSALRCD